MGQSAAAGGNGNAANWNVELAAASNDELMLHLHKYLLLLAILAATVTYVAGLNPPGGVWLDTQGGHLTGNQILVVTYHARYNAFSYSNATAFMASAVVTLLLLLEVKDRRRRALLVALRVVMSLDMLALVVAYAAGASRDMLTTVLASVLVCPIFIYVMLHTLWDSEISRYLRLTKTPDGCSPPPPPKSNEKRRKILMLLAIFATSVTYTAGLNPPGGCWPVAEEGHRAGDPVLQNHHPHRFLAFFICNTASFVASLSAIMLLLTQQFNERLFKSPDVTDRMPYVLMVISLLGLVEAYAAGSCRETRCTTGVPVLYMVGLVLVYFAWCLQDRLDLQGVKAPCSAFIKGIFQCFSFLWEKQVPAAQVHQEQYLDGLKKARSLVLLLATLASTVTYQAGLNPPGGFWPDDRDGHKGGDPILLSKHAMRYRVFFYCNSMALAASLVVIFMVLRKCLEKISTKHTKTLVALVTVMILDLISLIGAFAAGCGRDVSTSIYVVALGGGTLVYVVFHMVFFTLHRLDNLHEKDDAVEKKRKRLLLLAILAATLTYQAGLTPPGGFWLMDGEAGHHAGDPVLLSNYPRRYAAFFYLNATGFMSSVALTILLVNQNLYRVAIKCHALYVCMVAALFGLMGAYAAGSSRHVRTSIYMIALIGGVVITFVIILQILKSSEDEVDLVPKGTGCGCTEDDLEKGDRDRGTVNAATAASLSPSTEGSNTSSTETTNNLSPSTEGSNTSSTETSNNLSPSTEGSNTSSTENTDNITQRKYLMLLGILAASVSYQAGLAPPGGVWPDNNDGHAVGNPILHDSNHRRYHIFFYCNSTSFMASMVVITLQLVVELINGRLLREYVAEKFLIQAAQWMMVVDLIGLLGAYAAGSSREWETSGYIVALVGAVASYIGIHLIVSFLHRKYGGGDNKTNDITHITVVQVHAT